MDLTKLVRTEDQVQESASNAALADGASRQRQRVKKHSTMGKTSCAMAGAAVLLSAMVVPAKNAAGSGVATIFIILICSICAICLVGVSTGLMGVAAKRRKSLLPILGLVLNPAVIIALFIYLNWPTAGDLVPAASGGNVEAVERLLKMGIDVNQPGRIALGDDTVMSPLQAAADSGHTKTITVLLDHGASINDVDVQGRTALYLAVSKGHLNAALELLARGADPNFGPEGSSPLSVAVGNTQSDIVDSLLNHHANANPPDGMPLITAASKGNTRIAELLLQKGAEVNAQHPDSKTTALHAAAANGNLHMVQLLILKQAKPDLRNQFNETALELAINGGFDSVIERLVNAGSPIDIFAAVGLDDAEKVVKELEADESLIRATRRGYTPLHMAASKGRLEIAQLLIEKSAAIDARTKSKGGMTPLHLAVLNGHAAIVQLLLTHAADPNPSMIADGTTAPPLYFAVKQGRLDLVELLLESGADVNVQCDTPKVDAPPLYFAVDQGEVEIASALIAARADVNLRKNYNTPAPLHAAIKNHNLDMVILLIENNVDVNAEQSKETPLTMAELLRQEKPDVYSKIVDRLKRAGAKPSPKE